MELVLELVPPGGAGPEFAAKLIDETFGVPPVVVTVVGKNDPELLAAGVKARTDLERLRSRFAEGIPHEEALAVKVRFRDDDNDELMWVDVVAFRGDTLVGTLASIPQLIKTMRNAQKVKVKLANVVDYLHKKNGQKDAGGYSIEVFNKRGL